MTLFVLVVSDKITGKRIGYRQRIFIVKRLANASTYNSPSEAANSVKTAKVRWPKFKFEAVSWRSVHAETIYS